MKRIIVLLFVVLCSVTLHAQNNKEPFAYLNGGGYIGSHNNMGAYMGLEYDRQLNGNQYWGARLSGTYYLGSPAKYDWDGIGKNPYRNTVDQNIYKADAMIYYRIPIIKDIVKLRAGAGFGLGYHDIFDRKYTKKDKVIPTAWWRHGYQSLAHELLWAFFGHRLLLLDQFPVIQGLSGNVENFLTN